MVKLLALLALCVPAFGVTASPTSISWTMRAKMAVGGLWVGTVYPIPVPITISGTGSWGMARGGTLSTTCTSHYGYCVNLVTSVTSNCSGALPAGSDAGVVYACWNGMAVWNKAVGTYTGTFTIGSTTINLTLDIVDPDPWFTYEYKGGYSGGNGCVNTDSGYPTTDQCTITNERPPSTSFSVPSVAGSYVDPQFGYTVTRVTGSGYTNQYSTLPTMNKGATMALVKGAVNQLISPVDGTVLYTPSAFNINNAAWDPSNSDRIYYTNGDSIYEYIVSTATSTQLADYGSSSGSCPAFTQVTPGGTTPVTDDGWWTLSEFGGTEIMAVNLNGLTLANQATHTFCVDTATQGMGGIDFTLVSQPDYYTGERYVIALGGPAATIWTVGSTVLDFERTMPFSIATMHSGIGADAMGRQVYFWAFAYPSPPNTFLATMYLGKGDMMEVPVEGGGGLTFVAPVYPAIGHYGCTFTGKCIFTPDGPTVTAKNIQTLSAGNPCTINSTSHGYSNGNSVNIGGALGETAINGIWTITLVNANSYTIPVSCGSGYTGGSANSAIGTAPTDYPFRSELQIIDLNTRTIRRIAESRGQIFNGGGTLSEYFSTIRAAMDPSGRWIYFNSNFGVPELTSGYTIDTGPAGTSSFGSGRFFGSTRRF